MKENSFDSEMEKRTRDETGYLLIISERCIQYVKEIVYFYRVRERNWWSQLEDTNTDIKATDADWKERS